jgi:asparagine synthase (glutamine-hydrolysing)
MCGIAGILKFDSRDGAEADRLRRMRAVLSHRGPDGEGLIVDGQVGMVHRRLAIVDLASGAQPMRNEDGSIWIVFNGEIYNHADLRPELEARGHRYRTRSDTETILHLYEDEGEGAVERLDGMFAFAIWDAPKRRLLLARDRLGIKPLYVACTDRELLFGSEIKAILAARPGRPAMNTTAVPEYLASGFLSGDATFFDGIRRLSPAHTLTWTATAGVTRRRYWQLPAPAERATKSFSAAAADLRERLFGAVGRHLMSDVPLGVFLSGGIDSSALAAMVKQTTQSPVRTFAVGFSEREANELHYAKQVAEWIGSEHREVVVSPDQFVAALGPLVWHEDEPIAFPSSVPLYFLSQLASEHVKVVLTGEGADELFLGYNRYRVTLWNARLGERYWSHTPAALRGVLRRAVTRLPGAFRRVLTRSFVGVESGLRDLYLENFSVITTAQQRRLLQRPALINGVHERALDRIEAQPGTLLDRLGRFDLETYLHELLMKQDQMSMAASIESRVPFLDDRLVAHVAALPSQYKVRGWQTKAILRAAVRDLLPPQILSRRKMGFPVPLDRWFRGQFSALVDEFVLGPRSVQRQFFESAALQELAAEHRTGAAAHGHRLWLLINLEIWQRIFIDGESPQQVMSRAWPRPAKAA